MPALSVLVDNFNDDTIGPEWGNAYGGVSETGGRARVPCVAATYAGYQTARGYALAGSSVYLQIPTRPAASTATSAVCTLHVITATAGLAVGFQIDTVTGQLRCENNVDFFDAGATVLTYSPTDHLWLRIREDAGTVYWDTAPDGSTWTNRRTLATPAWITTASAANDMALDLWSWRDAGTTDYAEFDNVNTMSDGAVYTGTATGSAQSNATAAGTRTAPGTATGSAQSNATVTGAPIYRGTASGSAQSHATVVSASNEIPEVAAMAAGKWDLVIEQGSTFLQTYTVVDDPDFTWAGWSARAQIRTAASEAGQLLLDLTPYLSIDGPAVQLALPASITQTLSREGRWDMEMTLGATVVRILQGQAIISPEVTR